MLAISDSVRESVREPVFEPVKQPPSLFLVIFSEMGAQF